MRWILSLWCLFLLAGVGLAQGSVRFTVRDAVTRQPLVGARVTLFEGQARKGQVWTDTLGVAVAHGLAPGALRFEVAGLIEGIGYLEKLGKATIEDGRESGVCCTLSARGEFYQLVQSRRRKRPSVWVTLPQVWSEPEDWEWDDLFMEAPPPKPGTLTFQVRDAVTEKPLSCVRVLLKGPEITELVGEEDTDEDGKVTKEAPPGTYHYAVVAFIDGVFYERQRGIVTVKAGQVAQVTLSLRKGI